MAHDVFVSHSSKDKPVADAICANLEAAGVRCWIAPRDIAPGEDWPTAITNAIAQSRVMVLVFSASSNSSEDVGRELFLASNNKLIIIPFKIENIEPEPGKQYYLARTHWLDAMNPPTKEQISVLVRRVKSILSALNPGMPDQVEPVREQPAPPPVIPAASQIRRNLSAFWIAGALLIVGIIAAILYVWRSNWPQASPAPMQTPDTIQPASIQPPAPPTQIPVTPTPQASPTGTEFSENFNASSFDGAFDPNTWSSNLSATNYSFKQLNGAMVISKLSTNGSQVGTLSTIRQWKFGGFSYTEARLKLDSIHTGENGNIALSFGDSTGWWAGCGLQVQTGSPGPFIWCGQSSSDPSRSFDNMSDSYYIDFDKWYTIREYYDLETNTFRCYIDGKLFFSWQPANTSVLLSKNIGIHIGDWADDNTTITGYIDDVVVK
jgi:hypothetical protein